MNKMLPTPTRIKHEREITVLLTTLSEHTTACEKRIVELEKRLKTESEAATQHKRAARKAEQQVATLRQRLEDGKGEAAALATDLKLARAAQKTAEKDSAAALAARTAVEGKLATAQAERDALTVEIANAEKAADAFRADIASRDAALADARSEIDAFEAMVAEFRDTDQALRERIALLEGQLSDERTKAGKDLLLRIMELETMLEAERNKVGDLQELPSVVKLETRSVAANANAIKTSRRVSGGKR
ncbi:MAG: hypothetical protein AAGA11_01630 [Pseudomonadota bacterium]